MPRSLSDKRIEPSAGVHEPHREFWLVTHRTLDGTALSPDDRERLGRAARVEELADLLRSLGA